MKTLSSLSLVVISSCPLVRRVAASRISWYDTFRLAIRSSASVRLPDHAGTGGPLPPSRTLGQTGRPESRVVHSPARHGPQECVVLGTSGRAAEPRSGCHPIEDPVRCP